MQDATGTHHSEARIQAHSVMVASAVRAPITFLRACCVPVADTCCVPVADTHCTVGFSRANPCSYGRNHSFRLRVRARAEAIGTGRGGDTTIRDAEGTHRLSLPMLVPCTDESRSDPGQGIAPAFLFSRQAGQCRAAAHNRVAICMPQAQRPGNCPFSASRGIGLLESVQQNAEQFCPGAAICPRCSRFSRLFSVPHDAHNGSKAVPGWFLVQLIPPPPLPPYVRYGLPNCCLRQAT